MALLGAGSMGTAIVRRIGAGKKILLGDISEKALERVGEDFRRCGYDVESSPASVQASINLDKQVRIKPQMFQIECHPYVQCEHWQEMA